MCESVFKITAPVKNSVTSSMVPRFLSHLPSCVSLFICSPCKCSSCAKEGILQEWKYFSWLVRRVLSAMSNKASRASCQSWKNVRTLVFYVKLENRRETIPKLWICTCPAFKKTLVTDQVLWHFCCTSVLHPTCVTVRFACVWVSVCAFRCICMLPLDSRDRLVFAVRRNAVSHTIYCMLVIYVSELTFMFGSSPPTEDGVKLWNDRLFGWSMPQDKGALSHDACCKGSSQEVKCVFRAVFSIFTFTTSFRYWSVLYTVYIYVYIYMRTLLHLDCLPLLVPATNHLVINVVWLQREHPNFKQVL